MKTAAEGPEERRVVVGSYGEMVSGAGRTVVRRGEGSQWKDDGQGLRRDRALREARWSGYAERGESDAR